MPRDYVRERKLNVRARLELVAKIADAVHHAHQRGSSTAISSPRTSWWTNPASPKSSISASLALPTARRQSTLQTRRGQLLGTLAYMSPEQVPGDPLEIDTRTRRLRAGSHRLRAPGGTPPLRHRRKKFTKRCGRSTRQSRCRLAPWIEATEETSKRSR